MSPVSSLRLVFAGSPAAAVPSLDAIVGSRHELAAVITREDSQQGRKRTMTATPVAHAAEQHGIPVIRANRLAGDATTAITDLAPDLGVIVAYGGLVREPLLSAPKYGWINLHFSLLPRWRGAAPVQRAIIAGDEITGATVFHLVPELDAGDVLAHLAQAIGAEQTAGELLESLAEGGADLLVRVIDAIADGTARAEPQVGDVTLAPKLGLDDGAIDWTADAASIRNRVRGVTPEPGASTTVDGARLKVLALASAPEAEALDPGMVRLDGRTALVGTGTVPVALVTVQPAGKSAMPASDWLRGRSTQETRLGS